MNANPLDTDHRTSETLQRVNGELRRAALVELEAAQLEHEPVADHRQQCTAVRLGIEKPTDSSTWRASVRPSASSPRRST